MWLRYLIVLALSAAILSAGYISVALWGKIGAIDSTLKDQAAWNSSQLEVEYLKLGNAIETAGSGDAADLANLRKRFDIYYSRADIVERFQSGRSDTSAINQVRDFLDTHAAHIDSDDTILFSNLASIAADFKEIEGVSRKIALSSIKGAARAKEIERHNIVRLIELLFVVVLVVTIALVSAILRLLWQTSNLNRKSREAQENHLRLSTTLRASLDAIIVVDDQGSIKDFNGSAEAIFKYPREDAVGQDLIELLIPSSSQQKQRRTLARLQAVGVTRLAETGRQELEMIDSEGRVFPVELSASPARAAEGLIYVCYIRDITDKQHKEQEIVQARDDALAAYSEKSRFFAMMSHEMRTPLNGILSAIHLLDDGRLDAEQQQFLSAALTSGDILLAHFNDVLAIERIEAGIDDRQLQPCDLDALISGLIDTITPLATMSGAQIHLDKQSLDIRVVLTDPRAIQQILVNLISNAIKFAPDGVIALRVTCQRSEDEGATLHLEVNDDGPGIHAGDINRVFEDFVSLDRRYERRTGGTGLGLGIVRRLVHGLDGDIQCISEPGEGARFNVRLPVTPSDAVAVASALRPRVPQRAEASLRLLVVDDNEINRDLLQAMLQRMGHHVSLAEGGQEAVEMAADARFDAILMDISMPGVSGLQATRAILTDEGANRTTPVIAVTAHALPSEREEFAASGIVGFVQKPLETEKLRSVLESLSLPKEARHPQSHDRGADRPVLNDDHMLEMLQLLGREQLSERIASLARRVEQDMPGLIEAGAVDVLQERSHAMAGMCGMLGADRLHGLLQEVEAACKAGDWHNAREIVERVPPAWQYTHAEWRKIFAQ